MGKHERKLIEEAEKILVLLLNKKKVNEDDLKNNKWSEHAIALSERIFNDFPNLISAKHLGNRYDNTGDILIKLPGEFRIIEIKMSETVKGRGTKANISQNALTENGLFYNNPADWSSYREKKNHKRWVDKLLSKFNNYPSFIKKISNNNKKREEKARYLRKLAKEGNHKASKIMRDIQRKDRKEKISYLKYLSKFRQNKEFIRRFFILIKMGVHKNKQIKNLINKKKFFDEVEELYVYYSNFSKKGIIIAREKVGHEIKKIVNNIKYFKIEFLKNLTYCKLIGIKNNKKITLLQIVFHWKNIAQGIKTPCLNIFD
ncbi:MAG: hypothetical protein U5L76_02315 [Patescibacteria group bacterium]|nr:hypothetical protein [Patescibacteria group bacterium]